MTRPRLLDLFCGAGGCSVGYRLAGFDVVGVDNRPQPSYPFQFVQDDAVRLLRWLLDGNGFAFPVADPHPWNVGKHWNLDDFDAIHASPPCQIHSAAKRIGNARPGHIDLVGETRELLEKTGKPWVIENVPGAPLNRPVVLCGTQFGLPLRRHRLFESNVLLFGSANPCRHRDGDKTIFGHAVQLCGTRGTPYRDATGRTHWRQKRVALVEGQEAMGVWWMNRAELSQAIPPAYTEYVGRQLFAAVESMKAA